MAAISDNLARVRGRMEAAARRSGRDPQTVRLVAVSKTVGIGEIQQAVAAGVSILGENYVQEARRKIEALGRHVAWHFIGRLQTNKARSAVQLFDLIHSVDRLELARELAREARRQGRILPVLLQINLAGEESKAGAREGEIRNLAEGAAALEGILVRGLMTMPPFSEDPETSRPYFAALRKWGERLRGIPRLALEELSMGMSGDFEVAIEEGATLVRIGTAIFGPRPPR